MPLETNLLRMMANRPETPQDISDELEAAADYIDLLRRQLNEAHSHNADSERLDWLELQAHYEYSKSSHRSYFVLPRICGKKEGEPARALRHSIDELRHVEMRDD